MTTYLFQGVVRPERAQISLSCSLSCKHITSDEKGTARVSIVLNQVAVWIEAKTVWDIFDLRNVVRTIISHELAVVGFIKGLAYDLEIQRVLNPQQGIDYVFGIDIPCLSKRNKEVELHSRLAQIRGKVSGVEGAILHRCFADLVSAMKDADDTGFYCYRAIEALRQHCVVRFKLDPSKKVEQWSELRIRADCTEAVLREIKSAADAPRHGEIVKMTSAQRERLFLVTWDVVDGYLAGI